MGKNFKWVPPEYRLEGEKCITYVVTEKQNHEINSCKMDSILGYVAKEKKKMSSWESKLLKTGIFAP